MQFRCALLYAVQLQTKPFIQAVRLHFFVEQEQFADLGADPVGSTPQQYAELIRSETAKWSTVVNNSGAKVD